MDSKSMVTLELFDAYRKRAEFVKKVLDSPRVYYSDITSLLRNLWEAEMEIIQATGTIYNGP